MEKICQTAMKKIRSAVLAALCLGMALSLAACGSGKTEGSAESAQANAGLSEESAETEGTETGGAEAGSTETADAETESADHPPIVPGPVPSDGSADGSAEEPEEGSPAAVLEAEFDALLEEDPEATAAQLAQSLSENEILPFVTQSAEVEEGLLPGFDNTEITGFSEGATFGPTISTIAFVGYVFTLEEGGDVDAFVETLQENANPNWNICTSADVTTVKASGNHVFFLMCPASFDEE